MVVEEGLEDCLGSFEGWLCVRVVLWVVVYDAISVDPNGPLGGSDDGVFYDVFWAGNVL